MDHLPDAGFLKRRALLSLQHGLPHLQDGFSQQLPMEEKQVGASEGAEGEHIMVASNVGEWKGG